MEKKDLGSKKINGKQELNEGFSGENISNDSNFIASKLKTEVEIDADGNEKIVQRARDIDGTIPEIPEENKKNRNENEISNRGVSTEADVKKTVENKDRNSDITANRYPNSNPDNHKNRGNIKMDE